MKKSIAILLLACLLAAGCASTTTATEPQFVSISTEKSIAADAALYAALAEVDPVPASPVDLEVAVGGLDPAVLPVPPSEPLQVYQVGDVRSFWTHNGDTSQFNRITAELMAISKHAYFWQDQASQPLNGSGEIATPQDWAAAAESFDSSYEKLRAVFGHEDSPGLDGDPRLFVIHSDSLGQVGGYFGQNDLLPAVVEPHSNEGQYFYISNTWSSGIAGDYYKEVLTHEFQHMLQKNMDPNEDGWLNEGLSMLSQQVAGMRGDNFVADYLIRPDQSLWFWSGESSDYGQSYLYVDYLYEQMGQDFIEAVASDPANGLGSIDQVLVRFGSSRDADQLYADAMLAAYFDDPALAYGQYSFGSTDLPEITPRYEFTTLPALYQGTVQQYGGVDFITFSGSRRVTLTFTGDARVRLIPADAHSGDTFWWSNRYDSSFSTLTRPVDLTGVAGATLDYWAWYDIEEDYDYAYVLVSANGGLTWDLLPSTSSRETNPNSQNLGHGMSGISGGGSDPVWVKESVDLGAYAGRQVLLRFAMQTDLVVNNDGFAVDDLSIPEIGWSDDAGSGSDGWISDGFILSHNYVPQVWNVRLVEQGTDGTIVVQDLDVVEGSGEIDLDLRSVQKLVVVVIGQTRYTTIPASYSIKIKR